MKTVKKLLETKKKDLLTVSPEDSAYDTIKKMLEISAGTALVTNDSKLVGIVSERDFTRKVVIKKKCPSEIPVKKIMSTNLTTVAPTEKLDRCMSLMTDKKIRHLPVMDDGNLVGIVSIGDVVKYLISEKENTIQNLESYISGPGL